VKNNLSNISWRSITENSMDTLTDFSVNTNPFGVPDTVIDNLPQIKEAVSFYPDPECSLLTKLLAGRYQVPENTVLFGNGADDLLYRLAFAVKPKKALIIEPTYEEYARAFEKTGCEIVRYQLNAEENFEVDQAVLSAIQSDLDIVLLCNPNNPTGRLANQEIVEQMIEKCKQSHILLAVDECFIEFLPEWQKYSVKRQAALSQNIIVLDAFTKTYSLAGFRLGYCISGNHQLLREMRSQGPDYCISVPAQFAGICALMDDAYLPKTYEFLEKERAWLYSELCSMNIKTISSQTNYFLFQSRQADIRERLREQGIKTRDCSQFFGLDAAYCRIAIKQHRENEKFVAAMKKILL